MAFCANGMAASQWWRHGHSHDDECELWAADGQKHFQQLTETGSKICRHDRTQPAHVVLHVGQRWIGKYLVAECGCSDNCAAVQPAAVSFVPPKQVTHFHDRRLLWPTLSRDGKTMVFERNLSIWKLDLASGEAAQLPVHLRGVVAQAIPEPVTLTRNITEFAISHDGKKLAFVVQGQVFASPANGGAAVPRHADQRGGIACNLGERR